jgi:ASC-1-like (ASCH) protein
MNKKWKLIPMIVNGTKTIESRWYVNKIKPWNSIKVGERVFFKNSGESITVSAIVSNVLQFDNLDETQFRNIMEEYGDGIQVIEREYDEYYQSKNYCILVFLKEVKQLEKPFNISKKGFGSACAWMCVDNIEDIKL